MPAESLKGPYAPAQNVLEVIDRMRNRGLPDLLDANALQVVGVPEGNAPRTLVALKFLGLVGEDNRRTDTFDRIRRASTAEYPGVLEEVIRSAYAPVFTVVDPATDNEIDISDAFRQYEPAAQRPKMVTLFMALCEAAGVVSADRVRAAPVRPVQNGTRRPKVKTPPVKITDTPGGQGRRQREPDGESLFNLSVGDAGNLSDDEFDTVWKALGIVARAKARAARVTVTAGEDSDDES